MTQPDSRFAWVRFYEEFADKLLEYKDRRNELTAKFIHIINDSPVSFPIADRFPSPGEPYTTRPLEDICPFTLMASINIRNGLESKRLALCEIFKSEFEINAPVPELEGVPMYLPINLRWFRFTVQRGEEQRRQDIDKLWRVFEMGIQFADSDGETDQREFIEAFDEAAKVPGVGHRLPSGLYWFRPEFFPTLDSHSKDYLREVLGMSVPKSKKVLGEQYLSIRSDLARRIDSHEVPFSSFRQLSRDAFAWDVIEGRNPWVEQERKRFTDLGQVEVSGQPENRRVQAGAIAIRGGQTGFRRDLLKAYGGFCAITGYDVKDALDACHIKTFSGKDDNRVSNGLLLRSDIHNLFDAHLLGIDPDTGEVWISKDLEGTKYSELENREARPPKNRKDRPDPDALREHWEEAKKLGRVS
ncbi:MAG: HNH endonuclease signature motif containing protein [Chloroflexi bacterium]|nr:HNH endonuclease signature motif containing protein [Chloroflexota bacterium]